MKLINSLLEYPEVIPEKQVFMFTGNRVVTQYGLVMGGGNALACRKAYPQLPKVMGALLSNQALGKHHNLYIDAYKVRVEGDGVIGCMFTKDHYKDPSNLDEVIAAILDLKKTAENQGKDFTFHLPYPSIGLGGVYRSNLEPTMNLLPDNVHVYVAP